LPLFSENPRREILGNRDSSVDASRKFVYRIVHSP
jgi:hypothetical protein